MDLKILPGSCRAIICHDSARAASLKRQIGRRNLCGKSSLALAFALQVHPTTHTSPRKTPKQTQKLRMRSRVVPVTKSRIRRSLVHSNQLKKCRLASSTKRTLRTMTEKKSSDLGPHQSHLNRRSGSSLRMLAKSQALLQCLMKLHSKGTDKSSLSHHNCRLESVLSRAFTRSQSYVEGRNDYVWPFHIREP